MDYLNPNESAGTERAPPPRKPRAFRRIWTRFRRVLVFLIGLTVVAWSVFATVKTAGRERVDGYDWFSYGLLAAAFAVGVFILYFAVRGTDDDVRDISPL